MTSPRHLLVATHTGEPIQPVRLRFRVQSRPSAEAVLRGLESVHRDAARPGTWLWHYSHEAESVELQKRTSEIAKDIQPVVLADLNFSEPGRLTMRLRSPDRAIAAARFFCPRFSDAAVIERARILNRFVTPAEADRGLLAIDRLLDSGVVVIDPEAGLRELEGRLARGRTRQEKIALLLGDRARRRERDVPEVEDFPVDLTEETPDFMHLANTLRFRMVRAFQHWKGNPVTLAALIYDTLEGAGVSDR